MSSRRTRSWSLTLCLSACLALGALGCGDGGGGGGAGKDTGGGPGTDGAVFDPDAFDYDGTPGPGAPQGALEIILLHDPTVPVQVKIQDEFTIRARVIDWTKGGPAVDVPVTYEIVQNPGNGDATLAAKSAYTNEAGEVENKFRANYKGDVSYRVKLSTEGANDVFLDIIVSDTPKGSIEVHLAYEGPIDINTIKVRLMPKSFICGSFKPTYNYEGSLADKTVLDINAVPVFDGLAAGSHFTLIATAKSPKGFLAAAGCKDGVFVVAAQKTPTTLDMFLLPLNPSGNYDVDDYFDFTGALSGLGTFGQVMEGIVTLFNDPGKFLIDQIKTLVKQFIGSIITDLAFGLFEDELAKVITNWVKNDSPKWVQDFFTIGDDITQIVDNLHLLSVLKISKLTNDYYVQGIQYWKGLVLTWKYGCDKNAPDYDQCGVHVFTMDQFNNTQFPQDILEGKFTASIVNYDQLYIDNHVIQISYGKLILFVLNELILKTLTGENTFKGAVLKFVNCDSIAATFSNSVLDGIGLDEAKLADYCVSTIGLLITPIETWIGNLALDSQLRLSGHATMVDETDDLYVDKLIDGVYSGTIEQNGGPGPTFKGTWSGVKQVQP